jgi:capsular exopolysaccharide synthesis family protein
MDQSQINSENDGADLALNLMEYVYLLWRWVWLIVIVGILAGGVAFYFTNRTPATFQTSTLLFISAPNVTSSSGGMFLTYSMTTTYSQMLTNLPVLQGVVDKMGLKMDPQRLRGMITVSEVRDSQLISVTVRGADPDFVIEVANTLSSAFTERMGEIQSQRYNASKEALNTQIEDMRQQIDLAALEVSQTTNPAQKQEAETRLTQYRQIYASLVSSFEQVRIAEAQSSTNIVVTEPARYAIQTGPRTARSTLIAIAVGMMLAIGVIFAINFLDDTLRSPDEIRTKFGLPVLGVIAKHAVAEGHLITQDQPRSPTTESFRNLRTNIKYTGVDVALRRIIVTSPTPADGKTTIISNLAVVFAQGERNVVLIDADLRRPQLHHRFGLENKFGLSDLFVRPIDEMKAALQSTPVPGLKLITSGEIPPNPADLLSSNKMIEILECLSDESDLILIDTPPVLSVTDASSLVSVVDGVILVAKPGSTKLAAFQQAVDQLRAVNARILGVVLNEVQPRSRKYGYYYRQYYSKYSYYYTPEGEKVKKEKQTPPTAKIIP